MRPDEIKKFGKNLGLKIYADVSTLTDSVINEANTLANLNVPPQVTTFMVMEGMMFSTYYFTKKFKTEFTPEEFTVFYDSVIEGTSFGFLKLYLDEPSKKKFPEEKFRGFQNDLNEGLSDLKGTPITEGFKFMLTHGVKNFNWQFNPKFIDAYVTEVAKSPMEANFHKLKEELDRLV
jgi:hypothetical protein